MKPANIPIPKELKQSKLFQRKIGNLKSGVKNLNTKRQRIVISVNAGHIRGGHSFH